MGTQTELPDEFLEHLKGIKAKRAKTVIDHILKHGFITSEDLKDIYGYNHPPRAVRDVREKGVPIESYRVDGSDGKKIAAYKFGNPNDTRFNKYAGRTVLSKELKQKLIEKHGARCFIYTDPLDDKYLQIDHRIPFEVAGDGDGSSEINPDDFMLLCGSANRAKSWSCENCENWNNAKDISVCSTCYWAYPENYTHIALKQLRRTDILWQEDEITQYEELRQLSIEGQKSIQEIIKEILARILK